MTEVDYINGYIAQNCRRMDIPVPINSVIMDMIHEIKQNKRKIGFENFSDPVFNIFND